MLPVTSQQTGISVCGHGTAQIKPDRAQINAGVSVQSSSAQDARDRAASAMTAVINAIKSNGVSADDIQTGYVSISPQYDYSGGTPRTTGYTASNSVNVTVRDVSAVSKLIDAVTAAGGNSVFVSGVSFSSSDPSAAATQAQQKALADAKNQATHIAQGAGVNLGSPVSIQVGGCGNSSGPIPVTRMRAPLTRAVNLLPRRRSSRASRMSRWMSRSSTPSGDTAQDARGRLMYLYRSALSAIMVFNHLMHHRGGRPHPQPLSSEERGICACRRQRSVRSGAPRVGEGGRQAGRGSRPR